MIGLQQYQKGTSATIQLSDIITALTRKTFEFVIFSIQQKHENPGNNGNKLRPLFIYVF